MRLTDRLVAATAPHVPAPVARVIGRHQDHPLLRRVVGAGRRALSSDVVIAHGEGAGLRFNALGANAGFALGTSEPLVQLALSELLAPGQVVYDIGAASGFYTVIAARKVSDGVVVAFEPLPENAQRVRYNVALNGFRNVRTLQLAVGEHEGFADFSLGLDQNRGGLTDHHVTPGGGGSIKVRVATVDSLVAENEIPRPNVLKLDIERAEVAALRGAERTIREHRPSLLVETHGTGQALQALLSEYRYTARVLEDDRPVADTEWGMHLVAHPVP